MELLDSTFKRPFNSFRVLSTLKYSGVRLLSANVGWIFRNRLQTARAVLLFGLLYVLIYCLLRLEDNALLIGAVTSFLAISVVMYLTRELDWYGSLQPSAPA